MPVPLIKPLPLKVGLYYGNDFRNYKTSQTYKIVQSGVTHIGNVELGKENIFLFDYITTNLFQDVIPVPYLSNGYLDNENIDLIPEFCTK